jgi:hypothetical protein
VSTSVPPPGFPEPEPVRFELPPPPRDFRPLVRAGAAGVAVIVVAVIAVAVLGGSSNGGIDPVAQAAVVRAATTSVTSPGYEMRMSILMSSPGIPTPITATGTGTFDGRTRSGSFSMTMSAGSVPQLTQALGSRTIDIQEIVAGTTVYMKLPAATNALSLGGKPWLSVNLADVKGMSGLSSMLSNPTSGDPGQFLQYLRAESDSITTVGDEQVDGVMTTHYHVDLNFDRAANAVPAGERAAVQQIISKVEQVTHLHRIPADVWVDGQHLVRRMTMTIAVPATAGVALNEQMTVDFVHYGPEPRAAPPPPSQVADLSQLLGSVGG